MVLEAAMAAITGKSVIHPRLGWRRTTVVCAPKLRHLRQTLDLVQAWQTAHRPPNYRTRRSNGKSPGDNDNPAPEQPSCRKQRHEAVVSDSPKPGSTPAHRK